MPQVRLLMKAIEEANSTDEDEADQTPSDRQKVSSPMRSSKESIEIDEDDRRRHRAILRNAGIKVNKELSERVKKSHPMKKKKSLFKNSLNSVARELLSAASGNSGFKVSDRLKGGNRRK